MTLLFKDDLTEVPQALPDFSYWAQVLNKVGLREIPDISPCEKGLRFDNKTGMYSF